MSNWIDNYHSEIVTVLGVITVCLGILIVYLLVREEQDYVRKLQAFKETNMYLDTCFRRACLSNSREGLALLYEEMYEDLNNDKSVYSNNNFEYFRQIRAFIKGKHQGLMKETEFLTQLF